MVRFYHVEIARFAARADPKWVDNLLSHYDIPGVEGARQGLARRITTIGVYHIALIRAMSRDWGMGVANAVAIGARLLAPDGQPEIAIGTGLTFRFDRETFERSIDASIAEAVESITPARRGRPPRQPAR